MANPLVKFWTSKTKMPIYMTSPQKQYDLTIPFILLSRKENEGINQYNIVLNYR